MITKAALQEMIEKNADNYANKYGVRTVDITRRQNAHKAGAEYMLEIAWIAIEALEWYRPIPTGTGHDHNCMATEVGDDTFCNCSLWEASKALTKIKNLAEVKI